MRRVGNRQLPQRANREHRHTDTGLHVEDTRAMKPAGLLPNRHAIELADRPDGVEVAEEQHMAPFAGKIGADVVASGTAVDPVGRAADRFQAPRQLRAAALDGGLVGARRFEPDQRLDDFAHPGGARFAPGQEI